MLQWNLIYYLQILRGLEQNKKFLFLNIGNQQYKFKTNEHNLWLVKCIFPIYQDNGIHITKNIALQLVMFFKALLVSIMHNQHKSVRHL